MATIRQRSGSSAITYPSHEMISSLYRVVGGNVINYFSTFGINRRTDTVLASELPDGVAGGVTEGDVYVQATENYPLDLPDGFGVAQSLNGNFVWVVLDKSTDPAIPAANLAVPSLICNELILAAPTLRTFKKTVGSINYIYEAVVPLGGMW